MNPPSIAPPYRPQKHQPGNRNEPIPDQPLEVRWVYSIDSIDSSTVSTTITSTYRGFTYPGQLNSLLKFVQT